MKKFVLLIIIGITCVGSIATLIVVLILSNKASEGSQTQSYNSARWFFMTVPDDQRVPLFTFSDESGSAFVESLCAKELDKPACESLRDTASFFENLSYSGSVVALTHPDLVGRSISELHDQDGVFLIVWPKRRKVITITRNEIKSVKD